MVERSTKRTCIYMYTRMYGWYFLVCLNKYSVHTHFMHTCMRMHVSMGSICTYMYMQICIHVCHTHTYIHVISHVGTLQLKIITIGHSNVPGTCRPGQYFQSSYELTLVSVSALMVAVRVQLYRMASSPNSFPGPIDPRNSPRMVTCTSPSVCIQVYHIIKGKEEVGEETTKNTCTCTGIG